MHTSLATCPSCGHPITSSARHKLTVFELWRSFTLVQKCSCISRSLRACLEDFIPFKLGTQPHVLWGGVEGINPGISLKRRSMNPTASSLALSYITSWLFSSFQPRMMHSSPGGWLCLPTAAIFTSMPTWIVLTTSNASREDTREACRGQMTSPVLTVLCRSQN